MSPRENRCPLRLRPKGPSPIAALSFASDLLATGEAPDVFRSVLTPPSDREDPTEPSEGPAFFRDLNLDQIVASIIFGKQEYNLAPFFNRPLKTVEAIEYRQG